MKKKLLSLTIAVSIMATMGATVLANEINVQSFKSNNEITSEELTSDSKDGVMYESYDLTTQEVEELFVEVATDDCNFTLPSTQMWANGVSYDTSTFNYTPYWKRVTAVNTSPYDGIVKITTTYANGTKGYGTGFIVGDGKILTAAHNLKCDTKGGWVKNIEVYFEKNGASGVDCSVLELRVPSAWTDDTRDFEQLLKYDYGIIYVPTSMTSGRTRFGLYANVSYGSDYTITGYPWVEGSSSYTSNYMYTDTAKAVTNYLNSVKHDINIASGVSGAPMYNASTLYVSAIQTYGHSEEFNGTASSDVTSVENYGGFATLVTQDVIKMVLDY